MKGRTITSVLTATAVTLLAACARQSEPESRRSDGGALTVTISERATVAGIGADRLSDSASITELFPEDDGDAIPFVFADPLRKVTAGLGILDRRRPNGAQLIWPDSVQDAWWSGSHSFAFTAATGRGVRVVVDVHAETMVTIEHGTLTARQHVSDEAPTAAWARATAYVDSLRVQPESRPANSALRYTVTRLVTAPRDSLAAFHVAAAPSSEGTSGPGSTRTNPAWYALDLRTGAVAPIDSVIGPDEMLPEGAGAWRSDSHFVFAKGLSIHEAQVRRADTAPTQNADTRREPLD
jgi:hypothetical protein